MLFLQKDEVVEIHRKLVAQFGGAQGIRDEGLLDSALLAPQNREHYEGADLAVCAATYAYHLTSNHPFLDGNKRIGASAAEHFVQLNGGRLSATNDELVALFLDIAAAKLSRDDVEQMFARWVVL